MMGEMPRSALLGAFVLLTTVLSACGGAPSEAAATSAVLIPETEDQNFVEWARLDASPVESLTPGDDFGGLECLGEIVGDARIVAVGEPVYGAREIALLKRRMFEYLVRSRGVRAIVAEVGWSEALAIDEYLQTGRGNPETLLTEVRTWTWNTDEALELVRWMRKYNENVPRSRQLHFLGADMIYTAAAASALRSYLNGVDPEFLTRIEDTLDVLAEPESDAKYAGLRSREGASRLLDVERALDRLWRRRRSYADATSREAWQVAEHHGQMLRQSIDIWRASIRGAAPAALRERYLAENVRWILDRDETGGRIFLWSHNTRVSVEALQDGEGMGGQLQRLFGSDLVVIGILFNQGSFRARSGSREVAEIEIGPAPEGSVENSLSKVGPEMLVVDLRRATELVDQWLQSEHLMRETGTRFSDPNSMTRSRILGRRFDAVAWIDATTASSLTKAWRRSPAAKGGDAG